MIITGYVGISQTSVDDYQRCCGKSDVKLLLLFSPCWLDFQGSGILGHIEHVSLHDQGIDMALFR